jgi:hypothetical protein
MGFSRTEMLTHAVAGVGSVHDKPPCIWEV